MNRVVITGMGIVSSLGGNKDEVLESLKSAKTGFFRLINKVKTFNIEH